MFFLYRLIQIRQIQYQIFSKKISRLQTIITMKAEKNIDVIMPGFTHSQNAQPISFAHYLMSFFEMIKTGKLVLIAEEKNTYLHKLDIKTFKLIEPRINESIYNLLSPENSVKNKKSFGGTAFSQVKSAIRRARKKI